MKRNSILAALLLLVAGLQTAWGQGFRVYKSDGTVAQYSVKSDSIVFYDGAGEDYDLGPFTPVNSLVAGTWYKSRSEAVTFREDGTTDYISGGTYQFLPYQGEVLVYDSAKKLKQILRVHNVTAEELVVSTLGGTSFSVWSATQPQQLVTSITLNETSLGLSLNNAYQLKATVLPEDADNKEVAWKSSDEAVATLPAPGLVLAVGYGTCTITCSAKDGSGVEATCEVRVPKPVTGITVSPATLTLEPGETQTLTATVQPSDATDKAVAWKSSKTGVATVDQSGNVTAVAAGECTITATAKDGSGVKGTCKVTVKASDEQIFTVSGVTFKMKKVEGGRFPMGANAEQFNGYTPESDETPTHLVTLSDYWMGETEVTQALWYAVMGAKPTSSNSWSRTYGLGNNYPAYYVSWNDCQEFITKLNQLTGKTFRLPTEAEWEYAARGGSLKGLIFSGSNTIGDVAWYTENSSSSSHPVATKAANELGIYDMSGNVDEWCQDRYGAYNRDSQTNPTGPSSGSTRVFRGGDWNADATECRVTNRCYNLPSYASNWLGFRLAL